MDMTQPLSLNLSKSGKTPLPQSRGLNFSCTYLYQVLEVRILTNAAVRSEMSPLRFKKKGFLHGESRGKIRPAAMGYPGSTAPGAYIDFFIHF